MNLEKLFAQQQILKDRIGYNGEDRFEKLILALSVELGECANEWRGFKFWSKNQEPRNIHKLEVGPGGAYRKTGNPLLEEYVDGLHFVLELGLDLNIDPTKLEWEYDKSSSITTQFTDIYYLITYLEDNPRFYAYDMLITAYIELGEMLGFTWEQIEQAYMDKNAVNHERQNTGY